MTPEERAWEIVDSWFATHKEWPSDQEWAESLVDRVAAALTERDQEIGRLADIAETRRKNIETQDRKLLAYKSLVLARPYTMYAIRDTDPIPLPTVESFSQIADERDTLRAQLDALVEALQRYGQHLMSCVAWGPGPAIRRCTCGLLASLATGTEKKG